MEKTEAEIIAEILADGPTVLAPPPRIRPFDEPELLPERNNFVMSAGVARTPGGRLWLAWFGGGDDPKAYLLMARSDDDGHSWSKPLQIIKEPLSPHGFDRSVLGGNLWTAPDGRLWCFFSYSLGAFDGRGGVWCSVCGNPDAEVLEWSTPRRLWHGFALNKPVILGNGEWLLPISLWGRWYSWIGGLRADAPLHPELDALRMAHFLVSADQGATWERRGGVLAEGRVFDEPSLIERPDGSLRCLLRTHYGLAETISTDHARSWTKPEPSELKHCSSRIFTARLSSGAVLLVKHGPLYEPVERRSHLTAYLSDDDGASWGGGLLLDEREGVSYPDGFQAPDGRVHLTYDRKRIDGEILLAVFTEEDVRQGRPTSPATRLKIPAQRTAALS